MGTLLAAIQLLTSSCIPYIQSVPAPTGIQATSLPRPENTCQAPAVWHGLAPGVSTKEDTVRTLGEPVSEGQGEYKEGQILYYAYPIDGGEVARYAQNRIFFTQSGVVDWMEIVEADRAGQFQSLIDIIAQFGNTLDIVYLNNNSYQSSQFDVLAGPDQIYVWSECGVAIDALRTAYSSSIQTNDLECPPNTAVTLAPICSLNLRRPRPYDNGGDPGPDVNSIILMNFYFQPTSYKGFQDFYANKIPFGIWDAYLGTMK
jgi:hypothetical protein